MRVLWCSAGRSPCHQGWTVPWSWLHVVPQHELYAREAVYDGMLPLLQDLISIFNDSELELMVCGLPEIDTDDLRGNTEYTGYTPSSAVVQYFWEVSHRPCSSHQSQQLLIVLGPVSAIAHGLFCLAGLQCYTCARAQGGRVGSRFAGATGSYNDHAVVAPTALCLAR